MTSSAHVDRFVVDHLPPPDQWPELLFDLPQLRYPERLNCAGEILDKAIDERGWGNRVALRGPAGTLSYRELRAQANRIARVLVEDMGLQPGNRVLLHAPNSAEMAACWFAILKAGGIVVATMPLLRAKELGDIVDKARISHALCAAALRDELESAQRNHPELAQVRYIGAAEGNLETWLQNKADDFVNVATAATDPALIAFTSGTTGRPKGCVHFHRDVMTITDCFPRAVLHPEPDDIFAGISPLAFTYGLGGLLLFPLRYGASAIIGLQSSIDDLLQAIETHRATITFAVPTGYRMALSRCADYDLSSLRKCVSAGEPLPPSTRHDWKQATGIDLIDGIGSTEMLHIFIAAGGSEIRPGTIGKALPGYRAAILDAAGRPLPPGAVGRLAIKGPTGCRYLDDPRQGDYVHNGWNLTGDAGLLDTDGYFHYRSRTDDMIVSAGNNIGGPEIEEALLHHPAVAECAVIGVADAKRGQIIKAFVVTRAGIAGDERLAAELQAHVKHELAPYKYPRAIEFRDALPRTESGKLQRFKLRHEASSLTPAAPHAVVQPEGWQRPRGFSNGMSARGHYVSIAGQVGWDSQHRFRSSHFTTQARQALENVAEIVRAAGGRPEHIARLTWYITDKREYLAQAKELGAAYREVMGTNYPPMTVVQVAALIEDDAKVEIEATAILPDA
ncbi:MAG: AMP-binding protein [Rhodocyclaceae bacterium]|nr:AMP-binding protein [Rhodocyclaceae bacterium]